MNIILYVLLVVLGLILISAIVLKIVSTVMDIKRDKKIPKECGCMKMYGHTECHVTYIDELPCATCHWYNAE